MRSAVQGAIKAFLDFGYSEDLSRSMVKEYLGFNLNKHSGNSNNNSNNRQRDNQQRDDRRRDDDDMPF
jgi:hypothetical protein